MEILNKDNDGPKSEKLGTNYWLLPRIALNGLASVFAEGVPKYGMHNYLKPFPPPARVTDDPFDIERWEHMINHSIAWRDNEPCDGQDPVRHLYKVAWAAVALAERHHARQVALAAKLMRPINEEPTDTQAPPPPTAANCQPIGLADGAVYSGKSYVLASRYGRALAATRFALPYGLSVRPLSGREEWDRLRKKLVDYVEEDVRRSLETRQQWLKRNQKNDKANRTLREGLDRTKPAYAPGRFLHVWRNADGKLMLTTAASLKYLAFLTDRNFGWTTYRLGATPAEDRVVRQTDKKPKQMCIFAKDRQDTWNWVFKYSAAARQYVADTMAQVSPTMDINSHEWKHFRAADPEKVVNLLVQHFGTSERLAKRFAAILKLYRKCPVTLAMQREAHQYLHRHNPIT